MFLKINNKFKKFDAIILFGGPSSLKYIKQLRELRKRNKNIKIIAEAKTITPQLVNSKIKIDYILCAFPEKLLDNSFQNYLLRSFCSNINIKFFIKHKFYKEFYYIKKNFYKIYENWKPQKGQHKRYRIKKNYEFKNSPLYLLKRFKNFKIISDLEKIKKIFKKKISFKNVYKIKIDTKLKKYSYKKYIDQKIKNNTLELNGFGNLNSLFISTIPIVTRMGFKRIFLFGLDMNMMGTLEYSSKNIFKSFIHFLIYLVLCRKSFGANFKLNFPFIYLRPKSEFKALSKMFSSIKYDIYNVNEFNFFNGSIKNLPEIEYQKFFKEFSK
jgi:hypothetical protein